MLSAGWIFVVLTGQAEKANQGELESGRAELKELSHGSQKQNASE